MPKEQIERAIDDTIAEVMLTEHRDKIAKELSGGMKRKLSLAMAIVSKPKLIILDEPTSGLDIESRKQVWALIRQIKENRSIIMSSQHLEEADELADRICIMTKGQLLALDTPKNIKKQFGVGYKLMIERKTDVIDTLRFLDIKKSEIEPFFEQYKKYEIHENSESTAKKLIYQVPFSCVTILGDMLNSLE